MDIALTLCFSFSTVTYVIDKEKKGSYDCIIVPGLLWFRAANVVGHTDDSKIYDAYQFHYTGCPSSMQHENRPVMVKLLDPTHISIEIPAVSGPFFYHYDKVRQKHNFEEGSKVAHTTFLQHLPRMKYKILVVLETGEELDNSVFSPDKKGGQVQMESGVQLRRNYTVAGKAMENTSFMMYYSIAVKEQLNRFCAKVTLDEIADGLAMIDFSDDPPTPVNADGEMEEEGMS